MEVIVILISSLLGLGILLSPVLFIRSSMKFEGLKGFIFFNIANAPVLFILVFLLAWWGDASTDVLLYSYGFNFDGMSDASRTANVSAENIDRVNYLYQTSFGIGWPLKAIFMFVFFAPYPTLVLLAKYAFSKFTSAPNK